MVFPPVPVVSQISEYRHQGSRKKDSWMFAWPAHTFRKATSTAAEVDDWKKQEKQLINKKNSSSFTVTKTCQLESQISQQFSKALKQHPNKANTTSSLVKSFSSPGSLSNLCIIRSLMHPPP